MSGRVSTRLLVALAAVLGLVVGLAVLVDRYAAPGSAGPTLSVHSSLPNGARALSLWVADLGYETESLEYRPFAVDPEAQALFIMAPTRDMTEAQAAETIAWVERGGTLVLVAGRQGPLLDRLGVKVGSQGAAGKAIPLQPVFLSPPLREVEVTTVSALSFSRPEWVPLLGMENGNEVIAGVARLGSGRAFVLTAEHPLSNEGLARADNWALAHYFLRGVPAGALVLFDEYHHGLTEHGTLNKMLFSEPWGWAVLYTGALLFAYVVLSGRRFGPARMPEGAGSRRSRSEYVATVAALLRQGKHRDWLCRQFADQVKRSLGSRYRVRADLPATEFVAALARVRPDAQELEEPLHQLERGPISGDGTAVDLMREVEVTRVRLEGS